MRGRKDDIKVDLKETVYEVVTMNQEIDIKHLEAWDLPLREVRVAS